MVNKCKRDNKSELKVNKTCGIETTASQTETELRAIMVQ